MAKKKTTKPYKYLFKIPESLLVRIDNADTKFKIPLATRLKEALDEYLTKRGY